MDHRARTRESLNSMTQSQSENKSADSSNYSRPVIVILLLTCLCLAGFIFFQSFSDFDFTFLFENPLLVPALLLQIIASLLFILAWKILLQAQDTSEFGFAECAAQIGITLSGKYLPGKVWGLIGRTYLLSNRGISKSKALSLLLADQFITFYTGIMLGILALCMYFNAQLALPLAILSLFAIPIIGNSYRGIIDWLTGHLGRWLNKVSAGSELQGTEIQRRLFISCSLVYLLHWLATSAVLILLFLPLIDAEIMLNSSLIIAAIPLAMLAGFLAIWAPGGVGVREAVIIGILLLGMPLDVAVAIALSYRLICIVIDLVLGSFTLAYYSYTSPGLLRNKP